MNKHEAADKLNIFYDELIEYINKLRDQAMIELEPEPEQEFKVGEWVQIEDEPEIVQVKEITNSGRPVLKTQGGFIPSESVKLTKVISIQLSGEKEFAQGKWAKTLVDRANIPEGSLVLIARKTPDENYDWYCVKKDGDAGDWNTYRKSELALL